LLRNCTVLSNGLIIFELIKTIQMSEFENLYGFQNNVVKTIQMSEFENLYGFQNNVVKNHSNAYHIQKIQNLTKVFKGIEVFLLKIFKFCQLIILNSHLIITFYSVS